IAPSRPSRGSVGRKNSPALAGRLAELADEGEQPFPSVQVGIVEHTLEDGGDGPADLGPRPDAELAHHVGPVDDQIAWRKGRASLDLLLNAAPEVLEGVHPGRADAATDVVGAPQGEKVRDHLEADLPDESADRGA